MKIFILFLMIMLTACSQQSQVESDDAGYSGTYYDPITGEILFRIFEDSTGFKLKDINLAPYVQDESSYEKISLPNKEGQDRWGKFCGGDFSKIMERVLGGSDWKENTIWYIQVEKTFVIKVKKGYQSDEHIYNTNYVLIDGSECFTNMRVRRNIEKL